MTRRMYGVDSLPAAAPYRWQHEAACRDHYDPDLWFAATPVQRGGARLREARIDEAKQICAGCTVQIECVREGQMFGDEWSIRGGLTPAERGYPRRSRLPNCCHVCGARYRRKVHNQRYCGADCRRAAKRARQHRYERHQRNRKGSDQ